MVLENFLWLLRSVGLWGVGRVHLYATMKNVYFSRDILLQVESFENKLLSTLVISWRVELVLYTA